MKLSARTTWLGIIIGLLSSSVIANMVVLFVYAGSPSETLEEDWEERAANWDSTQQQRAQNRNLGWKIEATSWESLSPATSAEAGEPTISNSRVWFRLSDSADQPLAGARVEWSAFLRARPDLVHRGQALPTEEVGQYQLDWPFDSDRAVEISVVVDRNEQRFTHTWIEDLTFVSKK